MFLVMIVTGSSTAQAGRQDGVKFPTYMSYAICQIQYWKTVLPSPLAFRQIVTTKCRLQLSTIYVDGNVLVEPQCVINLPG